MNSTPIGLSLARGVRKLTNNFNDSPYRFLSIDISLQELTRMKSIIKCCPLLLNSTIFYISPSVAKCARFYALPKVHTPSISSRPIVTNIGTGLHLLANYLTRICVSLLSANIHTIRIPSTLPK